MSKDYMADGSLTEKWKYRFSFYDEHGFPILGCKPRI